MLLQQHSFSSPTAAYSPAVKILYRTRVAASGAWSCMYNQVFDMLASVALSYTKPSAVVQLIIICLPTFFYTVVPRRSMKLNTSVQILNINKL
jgi:hypothetical protein